jgi:hypothetical protein
MKLRILVVLLALLVSPVCANSTTYTICPSACSETSIQAVFDNNDLAGDDIVEVRAASPGASASYTETVTPGANDSGTSGHPVILRARSGDTITIDGQDTRNNGFVFSSVDYFTLDGFVFSNHLGDPIYGKPTSAKTGWTVQNCTINISLTNGVTGPENQGIGFNGDSIAHLYISHVLIDRCTIQTGDGSLNEQTDGITMYYVDTATVSNCTINLRNVDASETYQHIDGIQFGDVKNATIYNNSITLIRNHSNGAQGIYLEGIDTEGNGIDLGTWLVYNNVLYSDEWGSYALSLAQKYDTAVMKAYNNTVIEPYASTRSVPFYLDGDNVYFQNNLGKTGRDNIVLSLISGTQTTGRITNNLYYNAGGNVVSIGGSSKSWAQWIALGYDSGGLNTDPLLSVSYSLTSLSPAINAGTDLSPYFTTDIIGTTRPQNGAWDIGAYEYFTTGAFTGSMN